MDTTEQLSVSKWQSPLCCLNVWSAFEWLKDGWSQHSCVRVVAIPFKANVARQALALCLNAFACPCVWVRESMFMRARVCVFACVQESEWERKRGYTYTYRRRPWASLRFYLAVKKRMRTTRSNTSKNLAFFFFVWNDFSFSPIIWFFISSFYIIDFSIKRILRFKVIPNVSGIWTSLTWLW